MAPTCPSPEKCLFAGCDGGCHPPLAAFAPADQRVTARLFARDVKWRRAARAPSNVRDPLAHRRLLLAAS